MITERESVYNCFFTRPIDGSSCCHQHAVSVRLPQTQIKATPNDYSMVVLRANTNGGQSDGLEPEYRFLAYLGD